MGELSLRKIGGGSKIYTEADCTFDSATGTLYFPSGIMWSNITDFIAFARVSTSRWISVYQSGTSLIHTYEFSTFEQTNISTSATSIVLNDGGYPATYLIRVYFKKK